MDSYSVYFAGGLFSHKDLIGNAYIAAEIERCSHGKFKCILPQNIEFRSDNPHSIRDEDIIALLKSDLAIFNYDGTELDSGTVVEYMFAKFADIPALIMRTDFRNAGDCNDAEKPIPWNLMSSYYPRTETYVVSSSEVYRESGRDCRVMSESIAKGAIVMLEKLLLQPPIMRKEEQLQIYDWLTRMPNFSEDCVVEIKEILSHKQLRGIL